MKWAIFFSGWGRTAGILKDIFDENTFPNAVLDTLVCTGQITPLKQEALDKGYHIIDLDPEDFDTRTQWQTELKTKLQKRCIDLIFLSGFKYRIHEVLLEAFPNRIVNIHPSLLPSFKNTQRAIQEAMELGVMITGISTHIIDENIDEGIIIYQHPINIENLSFEAIDAEIMAVCEEVLENTLNRVMNLLEKGNI